MNRDNCGRHGNAVKKNAGAAGIDRMTVGEFAQREEVSVGADS